MTDSDIIKAMECCISEGECAACPIRRPEIIGCVDRLIASALDLIKRQQAEIERLKTEKENHPLTPEELKQMAGQPVWTVGVSHTSDGSWAMWDIIEAADDDGVEFGYSTEVKEWWSYNLHELKGDLYCGWTCYRAKPEVAAEMEGANGK